MEGKNRQRGPTRPMRWRWWPSSATPSWRCRPAPAPTWPWPRGARPGAPLAGAVANAPGTLGSMTQLVRHRFSVDDYERMGQAGVLGEDDRVELLEGEIVDMTPIGSRHAACVDRLTAVFSERLGGRAIVRVQNPVRLDDWSEPQPDIALLRVRDDYYAGAHPGPDDVLLLVEVADASAASDRLSKLPLFAAAGIAETWLLDLTASTVEIYRDPAAGRYWRHAPGRAGRHRRCRRLPRRDDRRRRGAVEIRLSAFSARPLVEVPVVERGPVRGDGRSGAWAEL